MRVVIAGGGTGGHVFPGIAVAQELRNRGGGAEITFIGTETGLEASVVPREGFPIRFLVAKGIVGKSLAGKIAGAFRMAGAVLASRGMLASIRPDVVIGTGGYVSFGPVFMGWAMSLPTLIMEQNLVPGLANRVLGRLVDSVAVTYHESMTHFPKEKTRLTGNPVRPAVLKGDRRRALRMFNLDPERFTLLVLGGSSGARSINNAAVVALGHLIDVKSEIQFVHQTGPSDREAVENAYSKMGFRATVRAFVHEMPEAYAAADLVLSRAGATTLAELTALGKPAVLVPYPYAGGHQEFNARKLADMGAAVLVLDYELTGEALAASLKRLMADADALRRMGDRSAAVGVPEAAARVADLAESLVRTSKPLKAE